jgi:hypothetical protein
MLTRTRSGQEVSRIHRKVQEFADSTSNFRKIDVHTLNVIYTETNNPNELCIPCDTSKLTIPSEVYVSDLSSIEIRSILYNDALFCKLDNKSKTFVELMNYIIENENLVIGTEESRTDAFVNHMLEKLEFGEYPLMIQPQPLSKFCVYTKEISSKSDFAILKNKYIMLVDEDKHIKNTGPTSAWGEHQIAGELIASAYCNYSVSKKKYNSLLYAIRIIGLKFTFYKAEITPEYLDSLGEGFPSESVTITRYPDAEEDKEFPHLDYAEAADRRIIVDMLIRMREDMLQR